MAVISISRQFGAGGSTLAGRLAQRLGYKFLDEELVCLVAKDACVADEWVKVTEREPASGKKGLVSSLLSTQFLEKFMGESGSDIKDGDLTPLFRKYIPELAEQDNVIFLGRGSQFILPDSPNTLKILLVATREHRVNFMMENHNLTLEEAEEAVNEWEGNRTDFLTRLTDKDPDAPSIYDLIFNTSVVRLEWVEDIVCNLIKRRSAEVPEE